MTIVIWLFFIAASEVFAEGSMRIEDAGLSAVSEAVISAPRAGLLRSIVDREGTVFEKGATLLEMDDVAAELAVEQAVIELRTAQQLVQYDAELRIARKELAFAESELRRSEESNARLANSVTEAEIDQLTILLERQRYQVERVEHDRVLAGLALEAARTKVNIAREEVNQHRVSAPFQGTVVQVLKHAGEWVQPGEPVLRILQPKLLQLQAYVPLQQAVLIKVGHKIDFEIDLPGSGPKTFEGQITFVSPEVNPGNGQILIKAEVPNERDLLRPGYMGTAIVHSLAARKPSP